MSRPRNDEYRRELARQAFDALVELGGVGVSMAALARRIGIKRSLLYFYFPDQRAICLAVLEELLARNRALADEFHAQSEHPVDQLIAYLDAVFAMGDRPVAELEALVRLLAITADSPVALLRHMEANLEGFRRQLTTRLEAGVAAGQVRPCDAGTVVRSVRAVAEGWLIQAAAGAADLGRARQTIVEHFIDPLRLQPHSP